MNSLDHAAIMNEVSAAGVLNQALQGARMMEERLPFTIRVVRGDDALQKAVTIRQAAYGRHVPEFAAKLALPEPNDHDQGSVVLLAESRLDGSPLGTMRIQTNRFRDLAIEQSVELPMWLKNRSMAEATRLGIDLGRTGRVVKIALFKALYQYCVEAKIEWMVISARRPLDRQYEALLFEDLFPGQLFPMRHVNDIPHRILAFDIPGARARWEEAEHPLLGFMCHTYHPDIDLGDAAFALWSPRAHAPVASARVAISA
ncbi:MAG: hypothetical protein ACTS6J_15415 [Burkholderiales bacterium]